MEPSRQGLPTRGGVSPERDSTGCLFGSQLTRELLATNTAGARGEACMRLVHLFCTMQWDALPSLWWLADVLQPVARALADAHGTAAGEAAAAVTTTLLPTLTALLPPTPPATMGSSSDAEQQMVRIRWKTQPPRCHACPQSVSQSILHRRPRHLCLGRAALHAQLRADGSS
jgi:hypothetical protein